MRERREFLPQKVRPKRTAAWEWYAAPHQIRCPVER